MALDRRMMLSLDDETYDVLMEFAEVSEKPAAAIVREVLQASLPQIKQATKMLTQLKSGLLSEGIETIYQATSEAQLKLFQAQQEIVGDVKKARAGASRKVVAKVVKPVKGKRSAQK